MNTTQKKKKKKEKKRKEINGKSKAISVTELGGL
jgi:hypothetical protein